MSVILVTYHSKTGNTKAMAEAIAAGVESGGATPDLRPVASVDAAELLRYQGYVVGSPVYYGLPAAPIKALFDESVALHGRLAGRVGAAFSSSANVGGGNESAILAILQMMLVHGIVVVGAAQGDHYGPVSVGAPDERALRQSEAHGKRVAEIAARLASAGD